MAERTGLAVSAIRFYEAEGLITAERNASGHRRFARSVIRRLSLIVIAQLLGYRLDEIRTELDTLPSEAAPTDDEWETFARRFGTRLDQRITDLQHLRDSLDGCIGCGCLSMERCALFNAADRASGFGPGPRYLLGDRADDDTPG